MWLQPQNICSACVKPEFDLQDQKEEREVIVLEVVFCQKLMKEHVCKDSDQPVNVSLGLLSLGKISLRPLFLTVPLHPLLSIQQVPGALHGKTELH